MKLFSTIVIIITITTVSAGAYKIYQDGVDEWNSIVGKGDPELGRKISESVRWENDINTEGMWVAIFPVIIAGFIFWYSFKGSFINQNKTIKHNETFVSSFYRFLRSVFMQQQHRRPGRNWFRWQPSRVHTKL